MARRSISALRRKWRGPIDQSYPDQRTDERNKVLRSCASDGADRRASALIRMFHGLLLSGESACKGECQCLAPMQQGHAGQGFPVNTGHSSAREIVEIGMPEGQLNRTE